MPSRLSRQWFYGNLLISFILLLWNNIIHGIYCRSIFKSWPEWNLNPVPLNFIQNFNWLIYQAMSSFCTQSQLCTAIPISSLKPLAHCWNVASLSLTMVDFHLNWLSWFLILILKGGLLVILIFLSPFPDFMRMSMSTVSLHNLILEFSSCRMLFFDCDLNDFKSWINKHVSSVGCF